jgi:hypothetical protein
VVDAARADDGPKGEHDREDQRGQCEGEKIGDGGTSVGGSAGGETESVGQASDGDEGQGGEPLGAVAGAKMEMDLDGAIVNAMGVPPGGAEEGIPRAEGADAFGQRRAGGVGVAFDAAIGKGAGGAEDEHQSVAMRGCNWRRFVGACVECSTWPPVTHVGNVEYKFVYGKQALCGRPPPQPSPGIPGEGDEGIMGSEKADYQS